jgi:hypothetical protein
MFGGLATFWGPLLGAGVLTLLPEWFDFLRDWYLIVYGTLFVLLMIVRPQGLIGRSAPGWWPGLSFGRGQRGPLGSGAETAVVTGEPRGDPAR